MNSTEATSRKLFFKKCSVMSGVFQDDMTKSFFSAKEKALIQEIQMGLERLVEHNREVESSTVNNRV